MTRIAVNGIHLNVVRRGAGKPLVLLHGFTGSTATWDPFLPAFGTIRTAVAVDLPGHGSSDSPPESERYRMERCVEDLDALFTRLGFQEYDLLGYSLGGRVALHLALQHGNRVGALILESTSPGIASPEERAERVRQDERLAEMLDREGLYRFLEHWENLPLFATQTALPPLARERLRRQRLAGSASGLAGSLRGLGAGVPEPLYGRLGALSGALLIAGERDEKYTRLAQLMGDEIPGARVEIVPGAGHAVHLEKPEVFEGLVMEYLRGRDSSSNGEGGEQPLPSGVKETRS